MRDKDIDDLMDQIDDFKKRLNRAVTEKAEDINDKASEYSREWREKARER